jgi:aspartyl protease family protein
MALSAGTRNVLKQAGSWGFAGVLFLIGIAHFDELRAALGFRLDASDLGQTAAASKRAEPEVRTIVKYIERPAVADTSRAKTEPTRAPRRSGYSVELRAGRNGHFEARAAINGRTVNVLVDTGATVVSLTYEDARAAGLNIGENDFRHFSNTANGRARYASVTLEDVRIGDIVVRNVQAAVSEPGKLNVSLLGMSFLSRLRLDMRPGQLVLEQ